MLAVRREWTRKIAGFATTNVHNHPVLELQEVWIYTTDLQDSRARCATTTICGQTIGKLRRVDMVGGGQMSVTTTYKTPKLVVSATVLKRNCKSLTAHG